MSRVGCNVSNCVHNQTGECFSNKISVNGKKARTSAHTCCSSFLEASNASFTNSKDESCSFISCNAKGCVNNAGSVCALGHIAVTSTNPRTNASSETFCTSFQCK